MERRRIYNMIGFKLSSTAEFIYEKVLKSLIIIKIVKEENIGRALENKAEDNWEKRPKFDQKQQKCKFCINFCINLILY